MTTFLNQTNSARWTLNSSISAWTLVITLWSWEGDLFPSDNFKVTLVQKTSWVIDQVEIVKCTSRSWDILTIERASENCPINASSQSQVSTAYSFDAYVDEDNGTNVYNYITAGTIDELTTAINAIETDVDKKLYIEDYQNGEVVYGEDTGSANTYEVNMTPAITEYQAGQRFIVQASNTNTGDSTININSVWAVDIKRFDWNDVEAGDINTSIPMELIYNWTNFILINPVKIILWQATTSYLWKVRIATDAEALAGTLENVIVNPKQLQASVGVSVWEFIAIASDTTRLTDATEQSASSTEIIKSFKSYINWTIRITRQARWSNANYNCRLNIDWVTERDSNLESYYETFTKDVDVLVWSLIEFEARDGTVYVKDVVISYDTETKSKLTPEKIS